jgi:hypothetical protein
MRYLVPGASVLNPHLIPAELVISTNSIGLESFLAVCLGSSFANGQVTQIVKMSQAIRMVFIGTFKLITNRDPETFAFRGKSPLEQFQEDSSSPQQWILTQLLAPTTSVIGKFFE